MLRFTCACPCARSADTPPFRAPLKASLLISAILQAPPRILVLDDDPDVRDFLCALLGTEGYQVVGTSSLHDARASLAHERFALFVSDVLVADGKATDLVRDELVRLHAASTSILLISGAPRFRLLSDELGADVFLSKPFDPDDFLQLVHRLLLQSEQGIEASRV